MEAEALATKVAAVAQQIENSMNVVSMYDISRDDSQALKVRTQLKELEVALMKLESKAKSVAKLSADCAIKQ